MVKKISGPSSSPTQGTSKVQSTQSVKGAEVGAVTNIISTKQTEKAPRTRLSTRAMSPEEREMLFQLIDDEANRLFGDKKISESKKRTIQGAVRMTVAASISEDDSDE